MAPSFIKAPLVKFRRKRERQSSNVGTCSSHDESISTPSTATARVLAIPELLEQILLPLPFRQLFVVQRVNHYFKSLVSGSEALQRRMLLRHQLAVKTQDDTPVLPGRDALSPLLLEYFKHTSSIVYWECRLWLEGWLTNVLVEVLPQEKYFSSQRRRLKRWKTGDPHAEHSPYNTPGSWANTLLTTVPWRCRVRFGFYTFWYEVEFPAEARATLRDVDDCVRQFVQAVKKGEFDLKENVFVWQEGRLNSVCSWP